MRSGGILSFLLKEYDINLHIDETDDSFHAVMFEKTTQKRVATLKAKKMPSLVKKCYSFHIKYKKTGICALN